MLARLTLDIIDHDSIVEVDPIIREVELPENSDRIIDEVEEMVLGLREGATRTLTTTYLKTLSHKKAQLAQASLGGDLTVNATPYRVDGEIGRLTFPTYALTTGSKTVWNSATDLFAALGPREYYRTAGMTELVLTMAGDMSYRKAVRLFNRVRHEESDPTPVRTVAAIVEREGTAMQAQIEELATAELTAHGFAAEGQPLAGTEVNGLPMAEARLPPAQVAESLAAYNAARPEALQIPLEAANEFYEDPTRVVNASIDDVGVKKQKPQRERPRMSAEPPTTGASPGPTASPPEAETPAKKPREYVHNTIAHVQITAGWYILNGFGTVPVLQFLVAFLLSNGVLSTHYLQFFVDGQRTLHAAILERLAWFGSKRILLDWFHLKEKCAKELSTLCRGTKIRNAVLSRLLTLLWRGRVDAAIAYLRALDPDKIKSGQSVETLIGYFERNRDYIPCYALRKQLGLRNSSNRGEKANDLCVAGRQKHQGMSWSKAGSVALASVVTVSRNQQLIRWSRTHHLNFQWVAWRRFSDPVHRKDRKAMLSTNLLPIEIR